MQHDEPGLFDLPQEAKQPAQTDSPITDQQVAAIRSAFEQAGIHTMKQRQELIQSCVIRPVPSIRAVYAREARRILKRIEEYRPGGQQSAGSAWDNRDEPTWIDKL